MPPPGYRDAERTAAAGSAISSISQMQRACSRPRRHRTADPHADAPAAGTIGTAPAQARAAAGAATVAGTAALPPEDQPEQGQPKELPPNLKRQLVDLQYARSRPAPSSSIRRTPISIWCSAAARRMRYGIGVGREGFTWAGTERISKMKEWPDWFPPAEMIERQPYLPRMMAGGPGNPLGARALYLGHTLYRIHGTNQPSTIGHYVSSGCIRLLNEDIEDLYSRVQVGTRVVVLPGKRRPEIANGGAPPAPGASANGASVMATAAGRTGDTPANSGQPSPLARRSANVHSAALAADLPIAALTRGITCSAISCIERLASAGSTQSMPA